MDSLPDLPQLERVEASYRASAPFGTSWSAACFALFMLSSVVDSFAFMFDASHMLRTYLVFIRLAAGLLWLLEAALFEVLGWRTDERGLTVRKFLRRSFIPWSDIREVRAKMSSLSKLPSGYRLATDRRSTWVPAPNPVDRKHALLIGSIRQHLSRFGKGDAIVFPEAIADLEWKVPDSIPQETDWTNPYPPSWQPLRTLLIGKAAVLLIAIVLSVWLLGWHAVRFPVTLVCVFVGGIMAFLFYILAGDMSYAVRASVGPDGIEADTGFGHVSLRWEDIRRADWNVSETALKIRGHGKTIQIPNHDNAVELILAILRRLRPMSKFETMPVPLQIRRYPYVRP